MAASLRTEELNPAIRFIVKISRSSTAGLTLYLAMPGSANDEYFQPSSFTLHVIVVNLVSVSVLVCGWLYLWKRRPQFTPVDVIETDVIPPDYTPGMLRLDAKLVYDDKGFCADIVNLIVKGKIHLEDQYDKNQQILIRVNEGATRNNEVLLPAEQLLLEALFRKCDKVVLTGDATESYAGHFTDAEILSAA